MSMPLPPAITRFAPSPTGFLHLGHAWSAVLAHDLAERHGGRFLLRIEDIDTTRCRPEFTAAIMDDLAWLGLQPSEPPLIQSGRRAAHDVALQRLTALGLTYPCFCTRADIAAVASAPHGAAHLYPGTCRSLAPALAAERAAREPHAIRLHMSRAAALAGPLVWQDMLAGEAPALPETQGDIVLARRDIGVGYMLAAVVDDGFQQVTHVVRGRDLLEATHVQRLLQALLGLPAPHYLHHPLLLAADGRRLAKRDRAEALLALREAGHDGLMLAARLRTHAPSGQDFALDLTG